MTSRTQIIDIASSVKTLPAVALELLSTLRDADADTSLIANIIEHDAALTANVLKLANAASNSLGSPICSIRHALVHIGFHNTAMLVLASAVAPYARQPVRGYDLQPGALWKHASAVAIATGVLADALNITPPEEAYTAGLLHDIGKLVLGHFVDLDLPSIQAMAFEQNLSFEQAEFQVLGIDHAEVGAVLLSSWGMSGTLLESVRWHHEPERAHESARLVVDLVHTSVQIITASGLSGGADGVQYHSSIASMDHLQIKPAVVEKVLFETFTKLYEHEQLQQKLTRSQAS